MSARLEQQNATFTAKRIVLGTIKVSSHGHVAKDYFCIHHKIGYVVICSTKGKKPVRALHGTG